MPRILTEQKKREKALRVAVCRAKEEQSISHDSELAVAIGIDPSTFSRHKKNSYQRMNFTLFAKMARVLGLTAKDLCDAVGVPYKTEI